MKISFYSVRFFLQFYILNLLVGYFIIQCVPYFFGYFDVNYISDPYRIVTVLMSFYIIFKSRKIYAKEIYLLGFFFGLLYLRMFYDIIILHRHYVKSFYEYFGSFSAVVVLPTLSLFYINQSRINWHKILNILYWVLFLFCFINIVFTLPFHYEGRSSGITQMWPISFGQVGVSLIILSFFCYKSAEKSLRNVYLLGILVGILVLLVSASKGPLLSLLVLILLILLTQKVSRKAVYVFILSVLLLSVFLYISGGAEFFVLRIKEAFEAKDASTIERMKILDVTFQKIKNHLFFGDSFLINTKEFKSIYPHNLILESLMTLGILGGVLFLFINIHTLSKFRYWKREENFWIFCIFVQYFIQSFFSFSLYSSTFFWMTMAMVLVFSPKGENSRAFNDETI